VPFLQFSSLVPLAVCPLTIPAASSFDRLFGADGLIGSVWLDATAPTLSPKSLHSLVVSSGLIDLAQAKSTYGHGAGGQRRSVNLTHRCIIGNPPPNFLFT
jgi:hypothetical protein